MGDSMKIGIITIQKCNNYGADLQAFALQRKLQLMGYDAENIDYLYYKNDNFKRTKLSKSTFKLSLTNRVKEFLYPFLHKPNKVRVKKFEEFFKKNVRVSRTYRTMDDLYADPPIYDVYITGSDQVWNPRTASSLAPYFLTFAPKDARKISYAASFGVPTLPMDAYKQYSEWLSSYYAISTREQSGAKLINNFIGCVKARHVVDPTLLLNADEWTQIISDDIHRKYKKKAGKYLVVYDLVPSDGLWKLARHWAEELGVEIVQLKDEGPEEYLACIKYARAMVTSAFHGVIFDLIFKTPFYFVVPKGMTTADRVKSILDNVGVHGRMVKDEDVEAIQLSDIEDFSLDDLRKDSVDWLKAAVDGKLEDEPNKMPLSCLVATNVDNVVRDNSTSGGVFSAIAEYVLNMGGIVFGAAWANDFHSIKHIGVEKVDDLSKLRGSKYVWSDPVEAYKQAVAELNKGRWVLFSGTPCQCAAIRNLSKGSEKLLTVDVICHGTPPAEAFARYVNQLEQKYDSKIVGYDFREKKDGWNFPRIAYRFANGKHKRIIPRLDDYYINFVIGTNLRDSCFKCRFASINRVADITIGDCWRVGAQFDDNRGVSNVLINSVKGQRVWDALLHNNKVKACEYDLRLAQLRNGALAMPARKGKKKLALYYWLVYWVKRLSWGYLRHRR